MNFFLRCIRIDAGTTEFRQCFLGSTQPKVRSNRSTKEFLHSVQNSTQSSSHSKAFIHSSAGHNLSSNDTAVDNRNADNSFLIADYRNQHNAAGNQNNHG